MKTKVLFFSSKYCFPCKTMLEMLGEVNQHMFGNHMKLEIIDIEEDVERTKEYNVLSVPTIIIGNSRITKAIDSQELTSQILDALITSVSYF